MDIHADTLEFGVPECKRLQTVQQIDTFLSKKAHRIHIIQQLLGRLTFLCATLLPGRALLSGLCGQLAGVLSQDSWVIRHTPGAVKEDLRLWKHFLETRACKPFVFLFPGSVSGFAMVSDASGSIGFACLLGDQWLKGA